jgi:hypothetical protein
VAAHAATKLARPPRPEAKSHQTSTTATACSTVWASPSASGSAPLRFCDPLLETTVAS